MYNNYNNEEFNKIFEQYTKSVNNKIPVNTEVKNDTPRKATSTYDRQTLGGNVSTIDELGEILRKLLNAAWGSDWGIISPEIAKSNDNQDGSITVPQIVYNMNLREITENQNPKPTLTDLIDERDPNGNKNGTTKKVYRQTYDCIVEFDFIGKNSKQSSDLMQNFEDIIILFGSYLKQCGVGEMFFLKEVPSEYSLNFKSNVPIKVTYYFVRIQKIRTFNINQIQNIKMKLYQKTKTTK